MQLIREKIVKACQLHVVTLTHVDIYVYIYFFTTLKYVNINDNFSIENGCQKTVKIRLTIVK